MASAYRCAKAASTLHVSSCFARREAPHYTRGLSVLGVAGAASAATVFLASHSHPVCCDDQSDSLTSWHSRWNANNTRWHLPGANPHLHRFLTEFLPTAGAPHAVGMGPRVLLPLCGKAVDMAHLARLGFRVVGIEGVRQAVDEFAQEHSPMGHSVSIGLPPTLDPGLFRAHAVLIGAGDGETTRTEPPPPVLMIEGDFLKVGQKEAEALVPFEAAFDRGSLVAVAPNSRPEYALALSNLIAPGGRVLLVTVEHDAFSNGSLGPPFEVTESDVHTLFASDFDVRLLLREDQFEKDPTWRKRGATRFHEASIS